MITSLRIAHFKAIADLTVPLGPITVLIGPNDSGKSTILQALMALSRAADKRRLSAEQILGCPPDIVVTDHDSLKSILFLVEGQLHDERHYRYSINLSSMDRLFSGESMELAGIRHLVAAEGSPRITRGPSSSEGWTGESTSLSEFVANPTALSDSKARAGFRDVAGELRATFLRLDPRAIARPSPLGANVLDDGSGLVGVVDELLTSGVGEDKIARANEVIRKLSPHVKGVAARLHPSGGKELHFALHSGAVIPASQMSDGVVLAAALVLIALGAGTRRLLIEEPENGLHPRHLRVVADTIRAIAAEHRTQVVLTTHSPLLLNYFGAEETVLVTRTEAGVSVRPMTEAAHFDELAPEMSLGELWYNVGDLNLVRPT